MKRNKQLTQSELCAFCQQIALVINAGLPIYYGVSILMEEAADPQTKELLAQIYTPMESGSTLHDAIKDTGVFPSYMIHMIRLGETTGHLEDVLESLSAYYEREAQIRAGIKSAAVYPLIMTALMLAVIFVMITKVVPVFTGIYEELGSELTGSARVLMHVSSVLNHYTTVVVIVFPIILVLCIILYHTELGRVLFQGTRLAMTIASGRVANCLHLVLSSGLDTDLGLWAIPTCRRILTNAGKVSDREKPLTRHFCFPVFFPRCMQAGFPSVTVPATWILSWNRFAVPMRKMQTNRFPTSSLFWNRLWSLFSVSSLD